MPKVLAQAGTSLADVYDVEGSVAGVEELQSRDVGLSHEMGATIFSERLGADVNVLETGDITASSTFDVFLTLPPLNPTRIVAVDAVITTAARILNAQLSVTAVSTELNDSVIWAWAAGNAALDFERTIRVIKVGSAVINKSQLVSVAPPNLPSMIIGSDQPVNSRAQQLVLRGQTAAFGAGTVNLQVSIFLLFAVQEGVSSFGLPIPSW